MENAWTALARLTADPAADVAALISSYQLKPHLLDVVVPQALRILSDAYVTTSNPQLLQTIYVFSRVRGHKPVMQHLPTDAMLIETLLSRLIELNDPQMWQAQYSLLLWLASVVLTPFELETIGADLWQRLYDAAIPYLAASGIQRDAAAIYIARLLTRKREDQARLVDAFVAEELASTPQLGELQVLAQVMDRVTCVPNSIHSLVMDTVMASEETKNEVYYGSMINSRLWIKIAGRVALRETAEFAEPVLAECFALLDSKSTRVRMTAAKYIARIAAKLPDENAEEVCTSLISSLDEDVEVASPDYYNGGLIALAEIVRRQVIHNPVVFEQLVVDVLEVRGLHFLQERLSSQVGTNVRDAACYVCWSLFRTVPTLDSSLRTRLFSSLTALAILDHEVNVRRAAAAALQEGLGRYGRLLNAEEAFYSMEHINFQTVSLVHSCYLDIAPLFCQNPRFFEYFVLHGVLNANADMRRLAATAIPKLVVHIAAEAMIDRLLQIQAQGTEAVHGKLLALGSLYTFSKTQYRLEEAQKLLIMVSTESDLLTEATLWLLPIAPRAASRVLEQVVTEEKHVIDAAQQLCLHLPREVLHDEILPVCVRHMNDCLVHVAVLVAMEEDVPTRVILQACRLQNPESRAMAVSRLGDGDSESVQQLIAALNDYSVDERGDVGGWVREAALSRVVALRPAGNNNQEIVDSIWKIASDSPQKLRLKAGSVLVELGYVSSPLEFETSERYYYSLLGACPESKRGLVAQGLAASVGGFNANLSTAEGSFRALVRYLDEADSAWVLPKIMSLDRSTASSCATVVRTLKRLVMHGIDVEPWKRALAIAFNTTLVPRLPESLVLDAIDILAVYAERSREAAGGRLLKLVKTHFNGNIRQAAADALFESGVDDDVLETTDWTRNDFRMHAQNLEINTL